MDSKLSEHRGPETAASLSPPPLLQLPIELVLEVCDHLDTDPASYCNLAITCKSLFSIMTRNESLPRLETENRNSFLCLLERDLGDRFYLCCSCSILRRFHKSWGPTKPDNYRNCERQENTACREGLYRLGYHHVRLVMMHHRSGGTRGIPLENLNQTVHVYPWPTWLRWRQDWSARIIKNELFVSAHHTLQLEASDEAQVRRALEWEYLTICCHKVRLVLPPGSLDACSVPRSCQKCLTDYTISVERAQEPGEHTWHITTYHQVGDGASPRCWKWQAYKANRYGGYRNSKEYPPGRIMETWNSAQS